MSNLQVISEDFYSPIKRQFVEHTDEATFMREINFAVQILKSNQQLQRCDADTVLQSVLDISQTGLTLNPVLNYAYLIPRYNSKARRFDCHLEIGDRCGGSQVH